MTSYNDGDILPASFTDAAALGATLAMAILPTTTAAAAVAARFIVGFVLLFAAVPKLAAMASFERTVAKYRLLPSRAVRHVARGVPVLELACAACLLVGAFVPVAASLAALLLVVFSGAIALNLLRGRSFDCGCGSAGSSRPIGWDLVVRDVMLAAAAAFAATVNPYALEPSAAHLAGNFTRLSWRDALAIAFASGLAVALGSLATVYLELRGRAKAFRSIPQGRFE